MKQGKNLSQNFNRKSILGNTVHRVSLYILFKSIIFVTFFQMLGSLKVLTEKRFQYTV